LSAGSAGANLFSVNALESEPTGLVCEIPADTNVAVFIPIATGLLALGVMGVFSSGCPFFPPS